MIQTNQTRLTDFYKIHITKRMTGRCMYKGCKRQTMYWIETNERMCIKHMNARDHLLESKIQPIRGGNLIDLGGS